jgi:putative transposase
MARLGRYFVSGQSLHVIQRGNDNNAVFFDEDDYRIYLDWLAEAAERYACAVLAYVLMIDHVHLLVTPERAGSLPGMMQSLGRRYVRYINRACGRTGTLWDGRYRATIIDGDAYFLSCCRYIELNPVRADMVGHPRQYPWSSYGAHGYGRKDGLTALHPQFARLGRSVAARQAAYRALFRGKLDSAFVDALRTATSGGWALGDDTFKKRIARVAKRRVVPLPKGRPKTTKTAA